MEALFGPTLLTKDGEKPTADALRGKGVVGIYFSAHWCPPCRGFTPKLSKWYLASLRDKGMAIVFVSSDKDQASFDAYFGEQPWVALPFGSRDAKATLSARFGVKGIPALILVDGATGDTINAEGRETVTADPRGTLYPWARGGAASPPGSPAVTNEPSAASPPGAGSPPEQQQSGELFRKDWKHTWKGGTYTLRGQTLRRSGTTKPVAEVQGIFDIPERRSAGGTKAPRAYRFDVTTATGTLVSLAAGSAASKARWVRSLASAARLLPLEDHPRSLDFERAQEGASIVDAAAAAGLSAEAAADCPKSHGLRRFIAKGDGFHCDSCREEQREGRAMYGCRACDYDVCEPCSKLPRPPICPSGEASCGKPMRLSVYDKEGYEAGWVCDRCDSDSGQTGKDSERWFCHDCGSDVCFDCLARPKMFNDAGLAVVRGAAADNCTDRFYCGTRRNIPGSDGQCGPSNGPQCSSCARFQSRYGRRDVDGYGNSGSDVELSEDDDGGGGGGSGSDDEDGDDGDPGDGDALGFDENDLDEMLTGHRPCCEDCAPFCRRPRGCCAGEDACISILCGSSDEKKSGACNQVDQLMTSLFIRDPGLRHSLCQAKSHWSVWLLLPLAALAVAAAMLAWQLGGDALGGVATTAALPTRGGGANSTNGPSAFTSTLAPFFFDEQCLLDQAGGGAASVAAVDAYMARFFDQDLRIESVLSTALAAVALLMLTMLAGVPIPGGRIEHQFEDAVIGPVSLNIFGRATRQSNVPHLDDFVRVTEGSHAGENRQVDHIDEYGGEEPTFELSGVEETFTAAQLQRLAIVGSTETSGRVQSALWWIWIASVALQLLVVYIGLLALALAYGALRAQYGGCMAQLHGSGVRVLDAVALSAVAFHPAVVAKLALVVLYNAVLVEGMRVADVRGAFSPLPFVLGGNAEYHGGSAMRRLSLVPIGWWLLCLVLSAGSTSLVIGAAFAPIALCVALLLGSVAWLCRRAGAWLFQRTAVYQQRKEQRRKGRGSARTAVRHALKKLHPHTVGRNVVRALSSMLAPFGMNVGYGLIDSADGTGMVQDALLGNASNLTCALVWAAAALALSPVLFQGACLAFHAFGGASPARNAALLESVYADTFALFTEATFAWPSLNFLSSLRLLRWETLAGLLEALDPENVLLNPNQLLELSEGTDALSLVVSLIRPVVSAASALLALVGASRYSTLDLAIANVTSGAYAGDAVGEDAHEFNSLKAAVDCHLAGEGHRVIVKGAGEAVRVRRKTASSVAQGVCANPVAQGAEAGAGECAIVASSASARNHGVANV